MRRAEFVYTTAVWRQMTPGGHSQERAMAFKPYPAKRYTAAGDTKYITGPEGEAAGWFDSPEAAAAAEAPAPPKAPKAPKAPKVAPQE